jgi:tetratricopeptide (TPR) repeat protein
MSQKNSDRQSSKSKTVGNTNVTGDENLLSVIQGDRNTLIQFLLKGVTLQLPSLSNRQRRFSQAVAIGIYVSCILAGFIKLVIEKDAGLTTKLLLTVGSVLLALTCCYYSWPWDLRIPEKKEKQKYEVVGEDSEKKYYRIMGIEKKYKEYEKTYEKESNKIFRQIIRGKCIAVASIIIIPLLTCGAFHLGRNMPTKTIVTLANYFSEQKTDRAIEVTNDISKELRNVESKDILIRSMGRAFQTFEDARRAGNDRFSTITVWGILGEAINTNFELLKPLPDLPKETGSLGEEEIQDWLELQERPNTFFSLAYDSLPLQEVNPSNKLSLTNELSYLIWFTSGLAHYKAEDWDNAIDNFDTALEHVISLGNLEPELDASFVEVFRSNTEARKTEASESKDGYDSAIEGYTRAIQLVEAILQKTQVLHPLDNSIATQNGYEAILASYSLVSQNQSGSDPDDNQEKICANIRPDEPLLVDSSPTKLKLYLARIYYNRGVIYALKDDPEMALSNYTAAWQLDPEMDSLCLALGTAYNDLSQYNSAIKNLDGGLGVNFKDPSAHNNLGNVYANRGDINQDDYGQAIREYTHAISQKRDFAEAYYNRGRAYLLHAGENSKNLATKDFSEAIKLQPDFAEAYYGRGISYIADKLPYLESVYLYSSEFNDFEQAIELQPDFAEAYYLLGKIYFSHGEDALETLSQSNEVSNTDHPAAKAAQETMIQHASYSAFENFSNAIENFNEVVQLRPNLKAQVGLDLAKAYYGLGSYYGEGTEAIENLSQAIQLKPDYVEAYSLRARSYIAEKRYEDAIADFNRVIKLTPNNAEAYSIRGIAFLKQGKIVQAIADFNKAIELEADFSEPYYELGKIYFEQGNYNQAIAMLNEATKWSNDVELYRLRANAYRMEGDYDRAIADLNQVIRLDPDSDVSYYTLGSIYVEQDNPEKAIDNFNKVIELTSDQTLRQEAQQSVEQVYLIAGYATTTFINKTPRPVRVTLLSQEGVVVRELQIEAGKSSRIGVQAGSYTIKCEDPAHLVDSHTYSKVLNRGENKDQEIIVSPGLQP